ncbi:unnamed protein product [Rotaria socialis]|uniref:Uncharacterized protein n=2 Tax=Rotaria socialis TaxID=392032 RepID=A0A817Z4W1_9BILA|nr:unnamed protein product [Rotaria socialis]CAF3385730.1 unnamed protein product [Rotaria socialis]CAF3595041.1 unnamed protein product [Rotaria socialis]CAF3649936.1 unnamed protein product [Rotaria socialis]CAF4198047.1 unnamed protein product [Rotaria socialis]
MEKSFEQLKHIERISRQTRRHRAYLNQICDQNLRIKLDNLDRERELAIKRSASCRRIEEERQQLVKITIQQIAKEQQQQQQSLQRNKTEIEQKTIQKLPTDNKSRPSSSIKLPAIGTSCRLFSHDCQLYPCQPVNQYTSFLGRHHDKTLRKHNPSTENSTKASNTAAHLKEFLKTVDEKKHEHSSRQLALAIQNQNHLVHRHISLQRTKTRLDEQSRLLYERLTQKKILGYDKERQQKLSQAIESHLKVTAKFCA